MVASRRRFLSESTRTRLSVEEEVAYFFSSSPNDVCASFSDVCALPRVPGSIFWLLATVLSVAIAFRKAAIASGF